MSCCTHILLFQKLSCCHTAPEPEPTLVLPRLHLKATTHIMATWLQVSYHS